MKAACSGCRLLGVPRPSMVVMVVTLVHDREREAGIDAPPVHDDTCRRRTGRDRSPSWYRSVAGARAARRADVVPLIEFHGTDRAVHVERELRHDGCAGAAQAQRRRTSGHAQPSARSSPPREAAPTIRRSRLVRLPGLRHVTFLFQRRRLPRAHFREAWARALSRSVRRR